MSQERIHTPRQTKQVSAQACTQTHVSANPQCPAACCSPGSWGGKQGKQCRVEPGPAPPHPCLDDRRWSTLLPAPPAQPQRSLNHQPVLVQGLGDRAGAEHRECGFKMSFLTARTLVCDTAVCGPVRKSTGQGGMGSKSRHSSEMVLTHVWHV